MKETMIRANQLFIIKKTLITNLMLEKSLVSIPSQFSHTLAMYTPEVITAITSTLFLLRRQPPVIGSSRIKVL